MGIENLLESLSAVDFLILVGCSTDSATVNVSEQNGLHGKIQAALPWTHWSWFYAHYLELACKDAF